MTKPNWTASRMKISVESEIPTGSQVGSFSSGGFTSYCNPGQGARTDLIHHSDNIIRSEKAEQGSSRTYTLNRLRRDAPELFDAVIAGKQSPNAAAIEAGFRRKPTRFETLVRTWRKASDDERASFRDYIDRPGENTPPALPASLRKANGAGSIPVENHNEENDE
jgi:hypothetical protein